MRYIAGGAQIVDIIAGSTALWRKSGAQQKKGANHKTIFINKVKVIKFEMNATTSRRWQSRQTKARADTELRPARLPRTLDQLEHENAVHSSADLADDFQRAS